MKNGISGGFKNFNQANELFYLSIQVFPNLNCQSGTDPSQNINEFCYFDKTWLHTTIQLTYKEKRKQDIQTKFKIIMIAQFHHSENHEILIHRTTK